MVQEPKNSVRGFARREHDEPLATESPSLHTVCRCDMQAVSVPERRPWWSVGQPTCAAVSAGTISFLEIRTCQRIAGCLRDAAETVDQPQAWANVGLVHERFSRMRTPSSDAVVQMESDVTRIPPMLRARSLRICSTSVLLAGSIRYTKLASERTQTASPVA